MFVGFGYFIQIVNYCLEGCRIFDYFCWFIVLLFEFGIFMMQFVGFYCMVYNYYELVDVEGFFDEIISFLFDCSYCDFDIVMVGNDYNWYIGVVVFDGFEDINFVYIVVFELDIQDY